MSKVIDISSRFKPSTKATFTSLGGDYGQFASLKHHDLPVSEQFNELLAVAKASTGVEREDMLILATIARDVFTQIYLPSSISTVIDPLYHEVEGNIGHCLNIMMGHPGNDESDRRLAKLTFGALSNISLIRYMDNGPEELGVIDICDLDFEIESCYPLSDMVIDSIVSRIAGAAMINAGFAKVTENGEYIAAIPYTDDKVIYFSLALPSGNFHAV